LVEAVESDLYSPDNTCHAYYSVIWELAKFFNHRIGQTSRVLDGGGPVLANVMQAEK
jgi:hypothetical protein